MNAAPRFARALFQAATEQNKLKTIGEEVSGLLEFIGSSKEFRDFLADRIIPPQPKKETLRSIFGGKLDVLTVDFLFLLTDRKRERYLAEILRAFQVLLDEQNRIATAYLTSAAPMTGPQRDRIAERLEKFSGYTIRIEPTVDPSLKGGFVVRLKDTVFDSSIRGLLERLHEQLRQGEFKATTQE